jgi:TMEM175 potassium channel family protein
MSSSYDRMAGQSIERLAALSDSVFAVAMTRLVLDLRAPAIEKIHSEQDLRHALLALLPQLLMYIMSFMTGSFGWATRHS